MTFLLRDRRRLALPQRGQLCTCDELTSRSGAFIRKVNGLEGGILCFAMRPQPRRAFGGCSPFSRPALWPQSSIAVKLLAVTPDRRQLSKLPAAFAGGLFLKRAMGGSKSLNKGGVQNVSIRSLRCKQLSGSAFLTMGLGLCTCGCRNRKLPAAGNRLIQQSRCRPAILRVSAVLALMECVPVNELSVICALAPLNAAPSATARML